VQRVGNPCHLSRKEHGDQEGPTQAANNSRPNK
jgi:hypothetical protein